MNAKAIDLKKEDKKKNLKASFDKARERIREKHKKKSKRHKTNFGVALANERSSLVDSVIIKALESFGFNELKGVSIVALGGYGRNQLCPYSDVDLLLLYKSRSKTLAKEVAEHLLYFLWDFNLEVGHSLRTVNECIELSNDEDTTIFTSLLDSRCIYGDKDLFNNLESALFNDLLPKISSKFITAKLQENENRKKKFGRSIYIIEPNVKECEGGLRDLHSALWIAQAKYKIRNFEDLLNKSFINQKEYTVINRCLNFLLSIRSELHYLAGRREDRLSFEFQERVAKFFGYKDTELKAVEKFMRVYYLRASLTHEQSERIIEVCLTRDKLDTSTRRTVYLDYGFTIQGGQLSVSSRNIFKENPVNLIRAFEYANHYEINMSRYLKLLIRENVNYIDDSVRRNKEFNTIFLKLLRSGKNVSRTLFLMNNLRLLAHYIPEFGKIVCMVQHDSYHVYTVDIHSIFMVKEIEDLLNYNYQEEFALLTKIAESLVKRDILYLACLLHDAGKGSGKGHSEKGARMVPRIAKRMGLSDEKSMQLEFLVRHHLIMPHFSQRRDIHDFSLIDRFALLVKSIETLTLLYLLTFADMRSVGPNVWTNWKGMLLRELYLRTTKLLEFGEYTKESLKKRIEGITERVLKTLKGHISEKKVRSILSKMPETYFLSHSNRSIANHVKVISKTRNTFSTGLIHYPNEGYDEFNFWGKDEKGIFSKLCGVVSASGLNILGARIVTTEDGNVLDVFYVNKLGKSTLDQKEIWDRVDKDLRRVIEKKLDIEEIVNKQKSKVSYYKKVIPSYPTKIEIDNESSELSTIIDVYAHDRTGLLYDVTKTIKKLGLSINYAKISTKVDQVVDVFYVHDKQEKKIKDSKKLEKIKSSLMDAINSP